MVRDTRILLSEFEWDENKSARNARVHGIDFEFATALFDNPVLEKPDARQNYGELRLVAIGVIGADYFVVVHTPRNGRRRIISARRASRKERDVYRSTYPS
jgi:uncharacterized DUF497 family protein